MPVDAWDEIRTAYHVARQGTVSGAATELGVHHATVIRHVDALEARLGTKLFQRHARGYTATEAGRDLLQVAQATDDQFTQLVGRLRGRGELVSGELVVTSLAAFSPLLAPVVARFREAHPDVTIRLLNDERVFRLEYGEAHVALRAGQKAPDQPDNVVQRLGVMPTGLYAVRAYLDRAGRPRGMNDLPSHRFVGPDNVDSRAPYNKWLRDAVPERQIVFRCTDSQATLHAVLSGAGLGFIPVWEAARYPDLVAVVPPQPEWGTGLWLVTHVDLHRTLKVQTLLAHLKQEAKAWETD
ncbi:MAG: LysR family transcriptional regulator [Rhodobacteraceae bacterium]|nr:LysR family transcriptional regulator [Paracoccaceae bacterium]